MSKLPVLTAPGSMIDTELMGALSDELRVRIFAYLCLHTAGPSEIAAALGASERSVRYRLDHLREGGWIAVDPAVRQRGQHYRANRAMILPPEIWDRLPELARHKLVAAMLRHLYADIRASVAAGSFLQPATHMSLTPMIVDESGRKAVERVFEQTLQKLVLIQKECDRRLQAPGAIRGSKIPLTAGLLSYEASRDPAQGDRASATMRL